MLKSLAAVKSLFFPPAPDATELAKAELEEAQRALLQAHSNREHADAMVQYHQRRIARLQAVVSTAIREAANDTPNMRALRSA